MASTDDVIPHAARAWEHFRRVGAPKYHVAPMVDQSELPFRMLCRKYGATAAYTPMLHARLFSESSQYRNEQYTTCEADRPLFVQFCANDPDILLAAAKHVESSCDYVDLNFGCPQRIAKRGNYGAFLMDDLTKVEALINKLHLNLTTPVSAKIRIFPELEKTLEYARRVEKAGASLVAVHGRCRDQKNARAIRADWEAIKAVKAALQIPVLGNGDIQTRADCDRMMEATGVDGVMSAESLLADPALFWPERMTVRPLVHMDRFGLATEYLEMCEQHPAPMRMVRGHLHKILRPWLQEHITIRDRFVQTREFTIPFCKGIINELEAAAKAVGRPDPVPTLTERALKRIAAAEALEQAKDEQAREEGAVQALAKTAQPPAVAATDPETAPVEGEQSREPGVAPVESVPDAPHGDAVQTLPAGAVPDEARPMKQQRIAVGAP